MAQPQLLPTPDPMVVHLTPAEMVQAAMAGVMRRVTSLKNHAVDHLAAGVRRSTWSCDIEGAAAELAVAKVLGLYWCAGVNTFKAPDVGSLQVRHTELENGCLVHRPRDNPKEIFVLVVGRMPTLRVVGWVTGHGARQPRFLRQENPPAWFVPQGELLPMGDILKT